MATSRILALILATLLFAPIVGRPANAHADQMAEAIDRLLPKNSRWELATVSLRSGEGCHLKGNTQEPLVPGSLVKLLLAGAAFDLERRSAGSLNLPTLVSFDGDIQNGVLTGNLYLQGNGNALLTVDDLKTAAASAIARGIREVAGHIVIDETAFTSTGLERSRKGAAYAPPGPLGLDLHTVSVSLTPTRPGEPPDVFIGPPNPLVRFAVSARTVPTGPGTLRIERLDDYSYKVTGNVTQGGRAVKRRFFLQEPAVYAGGVFKSLLQEAGIAVKGAVEKGKTPERARVLMSMPGPDLERLQREMNYHSLNVVADNLLLSLGAKNYGTPGTREKGVQAIKGFLAGLGLVITENEIHDGSGLSEKNRVTADFMARYLFEVSKESWFERFKNTLPRSGFEGSVRNLSYQDEFFHVKSGQLEDVYALAGYGVDAQGKDVIFCFIVNGPGVGILPVMDQVGAGMLRSVATGTYY